MSCSFSDDIVGSDAVAIGLYSKVVQSGFSPVFFGGEMI